MADGSFIEERRGERIPRWQYNYSVERYYMNGKDYILEAIERVEGLIGKVKDSKSLDGDPIIERISKACQELDNVKNKPTLRTKSGAHLAFPVYDAAKNFEEAWEDSSGGGDGELKARMEEFIASVDALLGALKNRTVIFT
jgi:hypothetical protein